MALDSDPMIDWDRRADGNDHTLVEGTHFTRDVTKVRRAANMWALRNDLRCLSEISADRRKITVRFVKRTGKV